MGAFHISKNRTLDLWSNGYESVTLVDKAGEDTTKINWHFRLAEKKEEKRRHSFLEREK